MFAAAFIAGAAGLTASLAARKVASGGAKSSGHVPKPCEGVLRIALVGCGSIANHHLHGIIKSKGIAAVTVICDPNTGNRDKITTRIRAETEWDSPLEFRSLEEALATAAPNFDAVAILVPNHLHELVAMQAIAAGKHVLIEKPIAVDIASGKRIIQAAKDAKVVAMVAENAQYWHEVRAGKCAF